MRGELPLGHPNVGLDAGMLLVCGGDIALDQPPVGEPPHVQWEYPEWPKVSEAVDPDASIC